MCHERENVIVPSPYNLSKEQEKKLSNKQIPEHGKNITPAVQSSPANVKNKLEGGVKDTIDNIKNVTTNNSQSK